MKAKQWIKDYVDFAVALVISILIPISPICVAMFIFTLNIPDNIHSEIGYSMGFDNYAVIGRFPLMVFNCVIIPLIMRVFTKDFWFIIPMGMIIFGVLIAITPGGGNFFAGGWTWTMTFSVLGTLLACCIIIYIFWIVKTLLTNITTFKIVSYVLVIIMLCFAIIVRNLYVIKINYKINYEILNRILEIIPHITPYITIPISVLLFIATIISFIYLCVNKKDNLIIPQDFSNRFTEVNAMRYLFEKDFLNKYRG